MKPVLSCLIVLFVLSCKKEKAPPVTENHLISYGNTVFDKRSSANLKSHILSIDTTDFISYTLAGYGVFQGNTRTIDFSAGGSFEGIPVVAFSGWDDFGHTFIAKDTSGVLHELFRRKFNSTGIAAPQPLTLFASKNALANDTWQAFSGWDLGNNTLYNRFQAIVLNTNASSSTGVPGCFVLVYSAPDYKDTVYFKPGKGPVEIRSWRAHMHDTNQPGFGGYH